MVKNSLIKQFNRLIVFDRMAEYDLPTINNINDIIDYISTHKLFRFKITEIYPDTLETISEIIWKFGKIQLLLEEAWQYIPRMGEFSEYIQKIIFTGRHQCIDLIAISQRAFRLNINLRSQYTDLYVFNQSEKHDIKWIQDIADINSDEIKCLGVGEHYHITPLETKKYSRQGKLTNI